MSVRSGRITFGDVRTITQTVHECRDLWVDPQAWQQHLLRRVSALAGCRIGLYLDMQDHAGHAADRMLAGNEVGWASDAERHLVVAALAQRPTRFSPLWANFADVLASRGHARGVFTARQDAIIARRDWQASEMYDRHVRPTRLGSVLLSAAFLPQTGAWSVFSLVTDRADPAPTTRHARLVRLMHAEIAPLIGTRLATWRDRTVAPLSPTRRRVLDALLSGLGEPEIAERSFRSRSAVHEHVTELYRHFGVRSRGELAAFFLRRTPVPIGPRGARPSLDDWLDHPSAA